MDEQPGQTVYQSILSNQAWLHSYCLPSGFLDSVEPHLTDGSELLNSAVGPSKSLNSEVGSDSEDGGDHSRTEIEGGLPCRTCKVRFDELTDLRSHFRSDWHRLNLKLKTLKRPIIDKEEKFQKMIENLSDSISGSNDDDDDNEGEDETDSNEGEDETDDDEKDRVDKKGLGERFDRLLSLEGSSSRQDLDLDRIEDFGEGAEEERERFFSRLMVDSKRSGNGPLVWFKFSDQVCKDPRGGVNQFGIYRSIFPKSFNLQKAEITGKESRIELENEYLRELKSLQGAALSEKDLIDEDDEEEEERSEFLAKRLKTWVIMMIGGGHFAGMVVSVLPKLKVVGKNKPAELEPLILKHKTFHRYTTRRKQGGSQSTHDTGGKGVAKSAGANLRRYNEQALAKDIQNLLESWSDLMRSSELIFIRSSKSNSKIIFDCKALDLSRNDPRLRSLPFLTKRPTFNELKRCFNELVKVKSIYLTSERLEQLKQESESLKQKIEDFKVKQRQKLEKQQLKKEQAKKPLKIEDNKGLSEVKLANQVRISKWERVIEIVKKGKLEALKDFLKKYDQSFRIVEEKEDFSRNVYKNSTRGENSADCREDWLGVIPEIVLNDLNSIIPSKSKSLLQIGCVEDHTEIVEFLLVDCKSDATIKTDFKSLTAYELCTTKAMRNIFRRAMAKHADWFDWKNDCKVTSALTEEIESNQNSKAKERKSKLKEKLRERDRERNAERLRVEAEKLEMNKRLEAKGEEQKSSGGGGKSVNRLDGGNVRKVDNQAEGSGLSVEQRTRLDRERRARAAEARLLKK
ncbi:hypothetical protein BY996DRAFT_7285665 [Phakopsora pachyrhizi]|uniref:Expressed protein n=1 Tax=Phakopsora pachyrhizi TaxID=170000 RepID=A0AAV0B2A0_PHAPC|nr:hypothetical protein BY996DRAFT_7285665 [Phakopsora pachyrhizi]CAH7675975.1 expressed protein [Phakopsora pachyrhizi]